MNPGCVTGVVLAGGKSARMGTDKASLMVDGRQMIVYAVDALREVFPDVVVVIKGPSNLQIAGARTAWDCIDGNGPLVGIYTALSVCETPYCFVVACDMPFANPALIEWMVSACDAQDVFVPRIGSYLEPLFALYSKQCAAPIRECLVRGDYRVSSLFAHVKVGYADETEIRTIDPELRSFTNINTREDLRYLLKQKPS